jgi:hypothetical protein
VKLGIGAADYEKLLTLHSIFRSLMFFLTPKRNPKALPARPPPQLGAGAE